jgi:pristinamycin I synthase-3/4
VALDYGPELHQRLYALARGQDCTLFMVLHAALSALLTRLGAGSDIVVGTPVAGRADETTENLIGFFANTLALRTDTSGDPSFARLLARVRAADLAAYAHQDVPFERVVEALRPERAMARNPLFQVLLAVQGAALPELGFGPLRASALDASALQAGAAHAKFDLEFTFTESFAADGRCGGLRAVLIYATDLFDSETAAAIGARMRRLLAAVAADPAAPVGGIDLFSQRERRMLGPAAAGPGPARATLPELFAARAAAGPSRIALLCGADQINYAELAARAGRLAHYLISRGIGPEQITAIAVSRSAHWAVACLAVAMAGGAYLPIDISYPADRIGAMLDDARPRLMICDGQTAASGPATARRVARCPVVMLDDPGTVAQISQCPATAPTDADRTAPLRDGHPAYVIYTSGSTGTPRGVVVPHRGLPCLAAAQAERFALGPGSRVLQFASPGFDAACAELWVTLLAGATLVLAPAADLVPRAPLAAVLQRHAVTHVTLPPGVLPLLEPADLAPVRTLVVAGEAVALDQVPRWSRGRRMINAYGPTETTVCATMSLPLAGTGRPIGRPVPGSAAYVLDRELRPVLPGVAGELYVAGDIVTRGYLGRPAPTAQRFVADPYGPPGARMYRTGDVVRWDHAGQLHFLGRADDQIILRGFRIDPGDVTAAITTADEVCDAAVVAREDRPGDHRLVGYLVAEAGTELDLRALRQRLARELPPYLVPAALVKLDTLPLTPNGKLDRQALPAPGAAAAAPAPPGRGACGPREELVRGLFAEVLGLPQVGPEDEFFELGGYSLLGMQLVSRIEQVLGATVALRTLFQAQSPAALAAALDTQVPDAGLGLVLPIRPRGDGPPLFCLPPAGGLAWGFSGLARHLPAQWPIYGLQAPGVAGGLPAASIEELAEVFLGQIRRLQPRGPYHLLGWSVGGLTAHAVAVRLQAQGERVGLLALLDAFPEPPAQPGAGPRPQQLTEAFYRETGLEPLASGEHADLLAAVQTVYQRSILAAQRFRPGLFRGDLLHVAAARGRGSGATGGRRDSAAWQPHITGQLHAREVGCSHHDMLRPGALETIAAILRAALDESAARRSTPGPAEPG